MWNCKSKCAWYPPYSLDASLSVTCYSLCVIDPIGLITIRVHALYGLNPRLKWILTFTFVVVEVATLYLSARESNMVAGMHLMDNISCCITLNVMRFRESHCCTRSTHLHPWAYTKHLLDHMGAIGKFVVFPVSFYGADLKLNHLCRKDVLRNYHVRYGNEETGH